MPVDNRYTGVGYEPPIENPNEIIDQLRARIAELEAEVEHLKSEIQLIIAPPEAVGRVVHELKAEVALLRKSLTHFAEKAFLVAKEGDLKTMSNFQSGGLFIADHVAKIAKKALEARDG